VTGLCMGLSYLPSDYLVSYRLFLMVFCPIGGVLFGATTRLFVGTLFGEVQSMSDSIAPADWQCALTQTIGLLASVIVEIPRSTDWFATTRSLVVGWIPGLLSIGVVWTISNKQLSFPSFIGLLCLSSFSFSVFSVVALGRFMRVNEVGTFVNSLACI